MAGASAPQLPSLLELYRVALLLTGSAAGASAAMEETFAAAGETATQPRMPEQWRIWLLRHLRRYAAGLGQKTATATATTTATAPALAGAERERTGECERWERVAALPEPARSAFAAFHAVGGSPEELVKVLELPVLQGVAGGPGEPLAGPLDEARRALAPEAEFALEPLLQLHRPWGGDDEAIAGAVTKAETEEETAVRLSAQADFDREWHEAVEAIALPSGLERLKLPPVEEPAPTGLAAILGQPAVMAIGVALLVMVGVGIFAAMQKMDGFPGKEFITALIEESEAEKPPLLEGIDATQAGRLGDWFLLKGFENFTVPPEFSQAKVVACRVYKVEGRSVAQLALESRNALLYVFRAGDVGIDSPDWSIYQQDDWAVAVRSDGENCYVVTFLGDLDDMPGFLREGGK